MAKLPTLFLLIFITAAVENLEMQKKFLDVSHRLLKGCNYADAPEEQNFSDRSSDDYIFRKLEKVDRVLAWNNCSKARLQFAKELMVFDAESSSMFPVPFDRSRCGWQTGSIGIVLHRSWMAQFCPGSADYLNHCCAQHFDCYLNQEGHDECDFKFSKCNSKTLGKTSRKEMCKKYAGLSDSFLKRSNRTYKRMRRIDDQTEVKNFEGNLHKPGKIFWVFNDSVIQLNVFRLENVRNLDSSVSRAFAEVQDAGWSKKFTIDSCALIFESCRHEELDSYTACFWKLNICLQEIPTNSKDLEETVVQFDKVITQFNKKMSSKQEKEFDWLLLIDFSVDLFTFFAVGWKICVKCKKRCSTQSLPIAEGSPRNLEEEESGPAADTVRNVDENYVAYQAGNVNVARNRRPRGGREHETIPLTTLIHNNRQ